VSKTSQLGEMIDQKYTLNISPPGKNYLAVSAKSCSNVPFILHSRHDVAVDKRCTNYNEALGKIRAR